MITLIAVLGVIFFFLVFLRLWAVIEYRSHIADMLEEAYKRDMASASEDTPEGIIEEMDEVWTRYWDVRLATFESVPQYLMVWMFWKPVESFFTEEQRRRMIY